MDRDFLRRLVKWYALNRRPLPWRRARANPYEIWISEVMSQQSTLSMMLPYYERWMKRFPDLKSLARAPDGDVLSMWAGLGYYSRARNIKLTAQALEQFMAAQGRWPQSASEWKEFKGIGNYTAAAIAAIAFAEPVIPVDGNVIRVFARYFGIENPLNAREDLRQVVQKASALESHIPKGDAASVAQSLMELGSQICRPRAQVICELCPIRQGCWAYARNKVAQIPLAKVRKKTVQKLHVFFLYQNREGGYLVKPTGNPQLVSRLASKAGPLSGQWELPGEVFEFRNASEKAAILLKFQQDSELIGPLGHSITHTRYTLWGLRKGDWKGPLPQGYRWSHPREILTTASRKILKAEKHPPSRAAQSKAKKSIKLNFGVEKAPSFRAD